MPSSSHSHKTTHEVKLPCDSVTARKSPGVLAFVLLKVGRGLDTIILLFIGSLAVLPTLGIPIAHKTGTGPGPYSSSRFKLSAHVVPGI
jgi:hypothetical protein